MVQLADLTAFGEMLMPGTKRRRTPDLVYEECAIHKEEEIHAYRPAAVGIFANRAEETSYRHWIDEYPLLPIEDEEVYEVALEVFEKLGDRINTGEATHAEFGYYNILSELISKYENKLYPREPVNPRDMVKHLMEVNELKQEDLIDEFGSQSRVSDFLNDKRDLTLKQVQRLAKRFKLNPSAFMTTK